jgi:hypothetical protein
MSFVNTVVKFAFHFIRNHQLLKSSHAKNFIIMKLHMVCTYICGVVSVQSAIASRTPILLTTSEMGVRYCVCTVCSRPAKYIVLY